MDEYSYVYMCVCVYQFKMYNPTNKRHFCIINLNTHCASKIFHCICRREHRSVSNISTLVRAVNP